jgi:hypothetical protein
MFNGQYLCQDARREGADISDSSSAIKDAVAAMSRSPIARHRRGVSHGRGEACSINCRLARRAEMVPLAGHETSTSRRARRHFTEQSCDRLRPVQLLLDKVPILAEELKDGSTPR